MVQLQRQVEAAAEREAKLQAEVAHWKGVKVASPRKLDLSTRGRASLPKAREVLGDRVVRARFVEVRLRCFTALRVHALQARAPRRGHPTATALAAAAVIEQAPPPPTPVIGLPQLGQPARFARPKSLQRPPGGEALTVSGRSPRTPSEDIAVQEEAFDEAEALVAEAEEAEVKAAQQMAHAEARADAARGGRTRPRQPSAESGVSAGPPPEMLAGPSPIGEWLLAPPHLSPLLLWQRSHSLPAWPYLRAVLSRRPNLALAHLCTLLVSFPTRAADSSYIANFQAELATLRADISAASPEKQVARASAAAASPRDAAAAATASAAAAHSAAHAAFSAPVVQQPVNPPSGFIAWSAGAPASGEEEDDDGTQYSSNYEPGGGPSSAAEAAEFAAPRLKPRRARETQRGLSDAPAPTTMMDISPPPQLSLPSNAQLSSALPSVAMPSPIDATVGGGSGAAGAFSAATFGALQEAAAAHLESGDARRTSPSREAASAIVSAPSGRSLPTPVPTPNSAPRPAWATVIPEATAAKEEEENRDPDNRFSSSMSSAAQAARERSADITCELLDFDSMRAELAEVQIAHREQEMQLLEERRSYGALAREHSVAATELRTANNKLKAKEFVLSKQLEEAEAARVDGFYIAQNLAATIAPRHARKSLLAWTMAMMKRNVEHARTQRGIDETMREARLKVHANAKSLVASVGQRTATSTAKLFVMHALKSNVRAKRAERNGVSKHFAGFGRFEGEVAAYDPTDGFELHYEDGDSEKVGAAELVRLLLPPLSAKELKQRKRKRSAAAELRAGATQ